MTTGGEAINPGPLGYRAEPLVVRLLWLVDVSLLTKSITHAGATVG